MTLENLINDGYEIKNAKITEVELSMTDHGCLVMYLTLDGGGWGCCFDGFLGCESFKGSEKGTEYIMRTMDTVGVEKYSDLVGSYVRVAEKDFSIQIIGNIIEDKWFSPKDFFSEGER